MGPIASAQLWLYAVLWGTGPASKPSSLASLDPAAFLGQGCNGAGQSLLPAHDKLWLPGEGWMGTEVQRCFPKVLPFLQVPRA